MKDMLKNTLILLIITVISGCALGFVYDLTKDTIDMREEEAQMNAFKEVFEDANSFEAVDGYMNDSRRHALNLEGYSGITFNQLNIAKDSQNNKLGYVFELTTSEGYGGNITFTMGVRNDGTLNGISILSISETAGLGMEAEKVLSPQFKNKLAENFVYTKNGATLDNEIDAISGATITTNAITSGVNSGLYFFNSYLRGGADNE